LGQCTDARQDFEEKFESFIFLLGKQALWNGRSIRCNVLIRLDFSIVIPLPLSPLSTVSHSVAA
jgi:hypothetical protein